MIAVYMLFLLLREKIDGDTKVTDMLLHAYQTASEGNDVDEELKAIKARYDEIITGLELKDFSLDDDLRRSKRTSPKILRAIMLHPEVNT